MARTDGLSRAAMAAATLLFGWATLRGATSEASGRRREKGHSPERRPSPGHQRRDEGSADRGRDAATPTEIPTAGWKDILWRTYGQLNKDRVLMIAAGVTFYALLALFPAMTAFISLYGLFANPETVVGHIETLSGVLPGGAVEIIGGQMEKLAEQPSGQLGFGFAAGLAIALWSANNGMKAIFDATNVAYNEREKRSFLRLTAITLLFTIGAMLTLILALGAIVVLPVMIGFIGLGGTLETVLQLARWPLLLITLILAISLIYRYGPSREPAEWRWISPGAVLASVVWVVVSIAFSWYVANFGTYNETYGSLGAVIGFMVWMWISTTIVLMGAELNAEIEHQTKHDTTHAPEKPMGRRGAYVADHLGESVAKKG